MGETFLKARRRGKFSFSLTLQIVEAVLLKWLLVSLHHFSSLATARMFKLSLVLLSAAAAFAAPVEERQAGPSVTIKNGTVIGSTSGGVDSFKGVPYAQVRLACNEAKLYFAHIQ